MKLIDIDNITALDIMHNVICDEKVAHKMLEFLKDQPTAYDVEAVVRKLEEAKEGFFIRNGEIFRTVPFEKAIEIITAGEQHD